ncbi:MAG: DUF4134 family protein [Bacteroidales bacterium]|nr:DUF4134 family protein [Bacteroidales bacterium]
MTAFKARQAITAILPAVTSLAAAAKCGGVDYTMGAEALARMHDFVVTMMMYVAYLTYTVASIVAVISALQIYIKINVGEEGVAKSIMTLIGAILFLIGATMVMPAIFGYQT